MTDAQLDAMVDLPADANLYGICYRITEAEDLIVFGEEDGVWGCRTRFSFHRSCGCWYVTIDGTHDYAMVAHIMLAYKIVCKVFGGDHAGRNGEHRP